MKFHLYSDERIINVGSGQDLTISDLADIIAKEIGYEGNIIFNPEYPDGTMRKVMDTSRIFNLGWKPKTSLEEGIKKTYEYYRKR
jgi:GDP-L-fucose synthase